MMPARKSGRDYDRRTLRDCSAEIGDAIAALESLQCALSSDTPIAGYDVHVAGVIGDLRFTRSKIDMILDT